MAESPESIMAYLRRALDLDKPSTEPVIFSATMGGQVETKGKMIVRRGPIFKLGDYPDKFFSLNAEEADANIPGFKPSPIDIEHDKSVFRKNPKGEFGSIDRYWREGEWLHGEVTMPAAFHDFLEPGELPVSCHFDPQTKQLVRLALTGARASRMRGSRPCSVPQSRNVAGTRWNRKTRISSLS